jgi:hypothetical protein
LLEKDDKTAPPSAQPPAVVEPPRTAPIVRMGASRAMLLPTTLGEAIEVAKMMSKAHGMVGLHLLNNPGGCLAVVMQAMQWGMSPFAVASKTYVAAKDSDIADPNKPLPPISFEAQLVHAVVLALAPTKQRPKIEFEGEGKDLRCIVSATFLGDDAPSVLRTEPLSALQNAKGSPLWFKKPQQQLAYNAVRDWARRYCPDVLMGVYTPDELQEAASEPPKPADDLFAGEGPKQITATSGPPPVAVDSGAVDAKAPAPAFIQKES